MAGFDDLLASALPYLATETIEATAGTTWRWDYELRDGANALIDLSSGFTVSATIRGRDGVEVVAPTVSFPSTGTVRCTAAATASAAVAQGIYYHEVTAIRASDSAKLIFVGAGESTFVVKKKVG